MPCWTNCKYTTRIYEYVLSLAHTSHSVFISNSFARSTFLYSNIQVENPVAVLDQEEAKKFLLGKADDKYNFFMKATELSRIDSTHASTLDKVDELDEARDRLKAGLRRKEVQIKELRSKCEQHKQLGKMKLKLLQQQVLLAFTIHSSHDEQYEQVAANVKAYQDAISQQEKKLADSEAAVKNPAEQVNAARAKMDQLAEEGQQQAALKTQLEQELRTKCHPCKVAEREMKDLQRKHKDADQKLKRAQDELQQARNLILQRNGQSEQARLMEEQKKVEEQINQHKEQTNQLKQNVSHALREYEELEPHVQNARNQVRNMEGQLSGVKNTIKSLNTSGDSLAMLGPRAKPMFQRVEEAKRNRVFKGPVVGPIGHYVKIRPGKEAYAAVAEFAIGHGTLDRFIVTNPHDRKALEKIRRQVGCRSDCGIFQIGNRPRFTFRTTPPDGVETLHTILQIEHDLVFNCLADNAGLESTAVCSDKATSERQLLRRNGSGEESIVGGINQVYLLPDGDNWTVRSGSRAMFTNEKKLRKTIGVDTTVALEEARKEEAQLKEDLRNFRTEESKLEHQHTDCQRNWNKAKQAFQANRREIDTLENRLEEIRGEIESTETVDVDTSELEQEIETYQQEKDSIVQQEQDIAAQIEDMQPAIEEAKAKLNECAARNDRVLTEMTSAEQELTQQIESKSQLEAQVEKRRKKLEKTQAALATLQEKLDVVEGEKEKSLRNARLLMFRYNALKKQDDSNEKGELEAPTEEDLEAIEPFDPPKDHAYYEAKIDTVKKKISAEKEKRAIAKDNEADAQEKYSRALEDFKNSKVSLTEIQENIEQLEEDMKQRKLRWKDMRNHLKSTTKMKFKELLSLNKYSGSVEFNDKEKTLNLVVDKEKGKDKGTRSKDVKSLRYAMRLLLPFLTIVTLSHRLCLFPNSGGERSYTTMGLLLALGERLETPFRILDEFDVFLDGPTRRLTIDMLIHLAKTKMGHRQFIFITPQDLSNIRPDPQLRIHRLKPPERNQRVGGPSQQTLNFSQSA